MPSTIKTTDSRRPSRKSVDALKQKFAGIDQSSSVTETTTSHYPKAGLILRSQNTHSSRSSTPGASSFRSGSVEFDESDIEIRSLTRKTSTERITSSVSQISNDPFEDEITMSAGTKRHGSTGKLANSSQSFLDSESKVTDINDLLQRMKNADKGKNLFVFERMSL